MKSNQDLIEDHQVMLHVFLAAERHVEAIHSTGKFDILWMENFIEFLKGFVDKCHHSKEEKELIPRMIARSRDDNGLIESILVEHMEGRRLVGILSAAMPGATEGVVSAIKLIADQLTAYITLLRGHITKENKFLFARADQILTDEDKVELMKGYERIEREEIGEGLHKHYFELAEKLSIG